MPDKVPGPIIDAAADLLIEASRNDPGLPALTDEQIATILIFATAALAVRSGLPPSKIVDRITDEGWPNDLVTRKEQP